MLRLLGGLLFMLLIDVVVGDILYESVLQADGQASNWNTTSVTTRIRRAAAGVTHWNSVEFYESSLLRYHVRFCQYNCTSSSHQQQLALSLVVNGTSLLRSDANLCSCPDVRDQFSAAFNLSENFKKCTKWKLDAGDYVIENQSLTLRVVGGAGNTNVSYEFQSYAVCRGGASSVAVCVPSEALPPDFFDVDLLIAVLVSASIVSLFVSLVLYTAVKPRTSFDARPLICHKISMLLGYVSFLVFMLSPTSVATVCGYFYVFQYYVFAATYSWLNVVAYDTWKRFCPANIMKHFHEGRTWKKFFWQSVYAWGVPLAIVVTYSGMSFVRGGYVSAYAVEQCPIFMMGNATQVTFYFVAIGLIMFIDVVLFLMIVINVCRIRVSVAPVNQETRKKMKFVYVKLSLIGLMGAGWIAEFVQWIVLPSGVSALYWFPVDVFVSSQGILLSLIYCCSSSMITSIKSFRQTFVSRLTSFTNTGTIPKKT